MLFSLLQWYIIPLSNFQSLFFLFLLMQTVVFLIFYLFLFRSLSPKSLMQAVHWVSPLCLKRKRSSGFPLNKTPICNTISHFPDSVKCLFSFSLTQTLQCAPLIEAQLPWIKSLPTLYFLPILLTVSQSRAASLSPPPYVVILISCSGLVSFVLLLLTCLCCKRGGVGFNVSLQHVRDSFTSRLSSCRTFCFVA